MTGHLHFSGSEQSCVLMADIADSTKTVFQIKSSDKLRLFYNIFITELSDIASRFEAKVIKNAGDGIICYFPKTADISDISAFRRVLHTGLQMIGYRSSLNISLQKEGLPPISYRISADYGRHEMVTDNESHVCDIFSQTINICAKIKLQRVPNQFVIGGDLYQIVKSIPEFCFKQRGEFVVDPKRAYPLYTVSESLDAKSRIGESRIRAETPFAQALKVFSLNKSRREFAKDRNLTGGD